MLTLPQLHTLQTDVLSVPALAQALADGAFSPIADHYNALTLDYYVRRRNVPIDDVHDAINWANLTPLFDPVADTSQAWANRSLACQGRQSNLRMLLEGRSVIDGTKQKIRDGFQDALTNVPSGTAGASLPGGWVAVQSALSRLATYGEKLFANTGTGNGSTAALAATAVIEGAIPIDDFIRLRDL